MFGVDTLRDEVKELKDENKRLRERVEKLEAATNPIRIGELSPYAYQYSMYMPDTRPTVSVREAIDKILAHLKIKFSATRAVPERIEVEEIK